MSENEARLTSLNSEIGSLRDTVLSIRSLSNTFKESKKSFVAFFADLYSAKLSDSSWQGNIKMLFSYYEDLCEAMNSEMASDFAASLDSEAMSPETFNEYCEKVISELKAKIEPLETERTKLVFILARETLSQAA